MKKQNKLYKVASALALAAILLSSIPYTTPTVSANLQPGTGDQEDCLGTYTDVNGDEVCANYTRIEFNLGNKGFMAVRDSARERPFIYFAQDFFENNSGNLANDVYKGTFEDLYYGHSDNTNGALTPAIDKYRSHSVTPVQTGSTYYTRYEPVGCTPNPNPDPGELVTECREVGYYEPVNTNFDNFAVIQAVSNSDGRFNSPSAPATDTIRVRGVARTGVFGFSLTCPVPPKPNEAPYSLMSDQNWKDRVLENRWNIAQRNTTVLLDFDDGDEWYRYRNFYDDSYTGITNPYPEPTAANQSPFTGFFIDKPLANLATKYIVWKNNDSYGTDTYGSYEYVDTGTSEVIPVKDGLLGNVTYRVVNYKATIGEDENGIDGKFTYTNEQPPLNNQTIMNQATQCGDFNYTKVYDGRGDWTLEYTGYRSREDSSQPSGFTGVLAQHEIPRIEYAFDQEINVRGLADGQHTVYVQAVTKDVPMNDHPNQKNPINERRYGLVTSVPITFWKGPSSEPKATIIVRTNKDDLSWRIEDSPPQVDACAPEYSGGRGCQGREVTYSVPAGFYTLTPNAYNGAIPGTTVTPQPDTVAHTSRLIKVAQAATSSTCTNLGCNIPAGGSVLYQITADDVGETCTVNVKGYWNGSPYVTNAAFQIVGAETKSGTDTSAEGYTTTIRSTGSNGTVTVTSTQSITVQKDGKSYLSGEQGSNRAPCIPGGTANLRLNFLSKPILEVR
jgi:hypothetical protein